MSTKRKINSKRPANAPRRWMPMRLSKRVPWTEARTEAFRAEAMGRGMTAAEVDQVLVELETAEMWTNDQYVVVVTRREDGTVEELSIRREDRRAAHDWRDFQRIKTEIAGAETEGFEIYPAESRLMDTANQYYLFCLRPGERVPAGYIGGRNVTESSLAGSGQRPLPEDWKDHA